MKPDIGCNSKKVAVTQRLVECPSYFEIRDALDIRWGKFLERCGFVPVLFPTAFANFEIYFETVNIDGILLTGGNNPASVEDCSLSRQRDVFEKKLLKFAMGKHISVLGVCRGAQIIADFFGAEFKSVAGHTETRHGLTVARDSHCRGYLEKLGEVNSYHNYAICHIPNELRIAATSEDGEIEAIEHKDFRIFGQMWHPEREEPFRQEEMTMFQEFFV